MRLLQVCVGAIHLLDLEDDKRTLPEDLRPADAASTGEGVQISDELVIELHEHLTPGHDHLLARAPPLAPRQHFWPGAGSAGDGRDQVSEADGESECCGHCLLQAVSCPSVGCQGADEQHGHAGCGCDPHREPEEPGQDTGDGGELGDANEPVARPRDTEVAGRRQHLRLGRQLPEGGNEASSGEQEREGDEHG